MLTTTSKIGVTPITPSIGAVIDGVDLRETLDASTIESLRAAWLDRGVLFFRNQDIDEQQLAAFVDYFAQSITEPTSPNYNPDSPVVHGGDTGRTKNVTEVWHSDATWIAEPPVATALRMVQIPPVGGDTCWSNVADAFDDLYEPFQRMLEKMTATHWMIPSLDALGIAPENDRIQYVHPVVTIHPETGRKVLFVNEGWTRSLVEVPSAQSVHILGLLYDHMKSPIYTLRWRWAPGDIALWDNRTVQHFAVPDYDGGRIIQRVVTVGAAPKGVY